MADIHHSFLGLLVTVLYLLTGVSGETLSMFSRVGDDVSLPCNNVVYPNCSSTIWIYNSVGSTVTVEEVVLGKIKVEKTERADRLSLGSDCSLHVSDVRAEDAGVYTCQQYLTETGPQHGADAPVHLSVLTSEYYCLNQSLNVTEKEKVKILIDFPSTFSDIEEKTTDNDGVISTVPGSTASTTRPALSTTSTSSAGIVLNTISLLSCIVDSMSGTSWG
uniref:Ig-like domain-containing protein n=1 Tax=Salmo trutta TaxID=8032 RepID=A0A673W5S5_SALTR